MAKRYRTTRGLKRKIEGTLVHLADELIDLVLPITQITTLDEVLELPGAETTSRTGELKWPKEVAGLLEVGANGIDFVDQILNGDNTKFAELLLNQRVVGL